MNDRSPEVLPPDGAYAAWAARYEAENAVTTLDALAVRELTPDLVGKRLLDAACGTGRRLPRGGAARPKLAVGVDRLPAMLRAGQAAGTALLINADLRHLPVPSAAFDIVWCRLALGHIQDLAAAYREFHRVLDTVGYLIVTDFHPAAARAGHRRSFRDAERRLRAVQFESHDPESHVAAARRAGFDDDVRVDLPVGPQVQRFYEEAEMLERYAADKGLPLLLALRFRR